MIWPKIFKTSFTGLSFFNKTLATQQVVADPAAVTVGAAVIKSCSATSDVQTSATPGAATASSSAITAAAPTHATIDALVISAQYDAAEVQALRAAVADISLDNVSSLAELNKVRVDIRATQPEVVKLVADVGLIDTEVGKICVDVTAMNTQLTKARADIIALQATVKAVTDALQAYGLAKTS